MLNLSLKQSEALVNLLKLLFASFLFLDPSNQLDVSLAVKDLEEVIFVEKLLEVIIDLSELGQLLINVLRGNFFLNPLDLPGCLF